MPQFTSRRCIIMLILLFGFFMFQFYSASIVGSLLMEKPKTIKTLRNLIDSPLKLGIEDILYNKDFFKVSTPELKHILSSAHTDDLGLAHSLFLFLFGKHTHTHKHIHEYTCRWSNKSNTFRAVSTRESTRDIDKSMLRRKSSEEKRITTHIIKSLYMLS